MSNLQPVLKTLDPPDMRAVRLMAYMQSRIPLVTQMQVQSPVLDAVGLSLSAPLAPNINHERTAFGGSLVSLATLACWGYLWLLLEDEPDMHIVVNEAHMRYLKPVTDALTARCVAPDAAALRKFLETLSRRGKARLVLTAAVTQGGVPSAEYTGTFVAYRAGEGA